MPLPQQVVEQLSREPTKTPGWFSRLLLFSGGILGLMLIIYFGLIFAYEPRLNSELADLQTQVAKASQSIPSGDQANLIEFYSKAENIQALLVKHVIFSNFFTWLEENTEANINYTQLSFSGPNKVTLVISGKTQADVIQQIAIFELSPQVQHVQISAISFSALSGGWIFSADIVMDPSMFFSNPSSNVATTTASSSAP